MSSREVRGTADNLTIFVDIAERLIGQPCWDAYIPNAEFLQLDIGDPKRIGKGRHPDAEIGSWGILGHSKKWYVEDRSQTEPNRPTELEPRLGALRGVIADIAVSKRDLALTVTFENGNILVIPSEDGDCDFGYWEIFTPENMIFQGGPGNMWRYRRNDL